MNRAVSCGPSGLPTNLLLSFSPAALTGALGVAAIASISRMVLVVTNEGAAGAFGIRYCGLEK